MEAGPEALAAQAALCRGSLLLESPASNRPGTITICLAEVERALAALARVKGDAVRVTPVLRDFAAL